MNLSAEDMAVLAHVVIDPQEWIDHAIATIGEWAITEKINKYRADYLAHKDDPDYKTRAEREA